MAGMNKRSSDRTFEATREFRLVTISNRKGCSFMKTLLVIAYLAGGHVIDTETLDAASMAECRQTRQNALTGVTPVTTRYGADVQITAECKTLSDTEAALSPRPPL
jgi:hypothetical protein